MATMEEKIAADAQYAAGAFDAIACLLATIARHQGLSVKDDVNKLRERVNILHPELEAHRITGYMNTIDVFQHAFGQPYP